MYLVDNLDLSLQDQAIIYRLDIFLFLTDLLSTYFTF